MKAKELKEGDVFYLISELEEGIRKQHKVVDINRIGNGIKSSYDLLNGLEFIKKNVLYQIIPENAKVFKVNMSNEDINKLYLNSNLVWIEYLSMVMCLKNYPILRNGEFKIFTFAFSCGYNINNSNIDILDLLRYVWVK